jgi:hypothetical protein
MKEEPNQSPEPTPGLRPTRFICNVSQMKSKRTLFLAAVLLAVAGQASEPLTLKSQSETWGDEAMSRTVTKTLFPGAKDEEAVRAQLAGINDSFYKTGVLFCPDEVHVGTFQSYPAFLFRGVSLANFTKRRCSITVVFTAEHTFGIHCFSPADEELPDPEKFIRIKGEPSKMTEEAFRFLEPRVRDLLPQMREMVRKLAAANGKKG